MLSAGHCAGLIPALELIGVERWTMEGGSGIRAVKDSTLRKSGLWAVWLLIQQSPYPYPLGGSLVLSSGQIMVLLCSSEGIMVLRSLANVYLLCARKPVTGTFPSGWKTKLIPVLTVQRPSAASEALMSLTFMSGRPGLWGSSALITVTDCPSQGLSPSQGRCLCAV